MSKINLKYFIFIAVFFCVASFILPFFFRSSDPFLNILTSSFTALEGISAIITLILAFLLYDRFGLKGVSLKNQMDKVFELADHIEKKTIFIQTSEIKYHLPLKLPIKSRFEIIPNFKDDATKGILVCEDDYNYFMEFIYEIKKSYWLPSKIKDKLKFIEVLALLNIDNHNEEKYVKFDFGNIKEKKWLATFPKLTFEMVLINLDSLLVEIDTWKKKYHIE